MSNSRRVLFLSLFFGRLLGMESSSPTQSAIKLDIEYGMSCMQNSIPYMQDRYEADGQFFGVYDGHGPDGHDVADTLLKHLKAEFNNHKTNSGLPESFKKAFAATSSQIDSSSGSTAVAAYFNNQDNSLHVAWVGDSRLVVYGRDGKTKYATADHNALRADERERVMKAGGFFWGMRVGGKLNMTRAFGNKELTRNGVIADPEVGVVTLAHGDWGIMASDGFWDAISENNQAIHLLFSMRYELTQNPKLMSESEYNKNDGDVQLIQLAKYLQEYACQKHSADNISVIVFKVSEHEDAPDLEGTWYN